MISIAGKGWAYPDSNACQCKRARSERATAKLIFNANSTRAMIKLRGKIKIKGDGQECPSHTGAVLARQSRFLTGLGARFGMTSLSYHGRGGSPVQAIKILGLKSRIIAQL